MNRDEREMMDRQAEMELHKAGLQGAHGVDQKERARLIETVIQSDLESTDDAFENLRARDFPLANYNEDEDTTEFFWMQEILDLFAKAQNPHPGSGLQGLARAWATGDSSDRRTANELNDFVRDEAYKLGTYSRAKRGEGMAQQETSAKSVTETHAVRDDESKSKGGLLGRFRG